MVDSIKHNMQQMLVPSGQDAKVSQQRSGTVETGSSLDSAGAIDGSSLAIKSEIASLAETPPVDIEIVNKIKQQIEAGNYPVNLDLISERLMESYIEMKD